MEVEHAANLSWNFQIVLAIVGDSRNEFGRHKIAFFSEDEARNFLRLAINKGASQKISNHLLYESPAVSPTSTLRHIESPTTSTLRNSRTFDTKRPLRPISENLQYYEESFIDENDEEELSATMPTHVNSMNTSSKILRRKSTGSTDTSKSTNVVRKKSPMSSTVSVSSVDQTFTRRNSMTGRFKKASVTSNNQAWYDNNRSNLIDNASTKSVDDEYYDEETLATYDDRLKAKKKSHNSLESEEMTSDDGCVTTPEESDLSESDEDASQPSLASPGSYEDLVRITECVTD